MGVTTKPHYGIDAPGLVRAFLLVGVGLLSASVSIFVYATPALAAWIGAIVLIPATYALFMFALMIRGSLVDKVRDAEAILDLHPWDGGEQVLDVGCGRGLMLVGAAKRLTTGKAVGVDIWSSNDQSANGADAPIDNARIVGVADRVVIQTADARRLPFADNSFDVVLSSWVIHNLEAPADRMSALTEMVRVLRPSGTILLTDIVNRQEYVSAFEDMALEDVRLVVLSPGRDRFLSAVSFGSFQPATMFARKIAPSAA
ncbi:class I SAM-dependent methyltransferase [soil metagenome]